MARPLRIQYPGAYYHVTCRGNERRAIFRDDADRRQFLELLSLSLETYGVTLYVYVLMTNHFHLVLCTPKGNLSAFMRHFNISYTMAFNRRHGRVGHLYQGRYKAFLVDSDSYLLELSRYVHGNPVRGDRFKDATIEEKWNYLRRYRGSSLHGYLGISKKQQLVDYQEVLTHFGGDTRRGRDAYARFIKEKLGEKTRSPLEVGRGHGIVGGKEFIEWVKGELVLEGESRREQPAARELGKRFAPGELIERFCTMTGEKRDVLCRKGRQSTGRVMLMELLYRYCVLTQIEIGKLMGGVDYTAVSHGRTKLKSGMREDRRLARQFADISNRVIENSRIKI
jgi:REP element-mobilizing transposase RayT